MLAGYFGGHLTHRCDDSPNSRARWGCDKDTKTPQWELLCPRCRADGSVGGHTCSLCEGKKVLPQNRCPIHTFETPIYVDEVFRAYAFFKNYQVLPVAGGMYDQTSFFVSVVSFCDSIIGKYEERSEDKANRLKDMAEKAKHGAAINGGRT